MSTINILVTGANGQLGNELKAIYNSDNFKIGKSVNVVFTDIDTLDLTNTIFLKKYLTDHPYNYIINCAAYTLVDKAETESEKAFSVNSKCVKGIIDSIKAYKTKLIHISTDYVFDGNSSQPYTEGMPTNPQSVYGKSKVEGEEIALKYEHAIVIRTSWLYSTFGNNFAKTIHKISKEKDLINVVFDQIGTPTYAHDLADAIVQIIYQSEKSKNFVPGLYHYSNEGVCSWYDFARAIAIKSYSCSTINPIESKDYPTPVKRPFYSVLNKGKIKSIFNLSIPHWEDSLNEFFKHLK